MKQNNSNEYLIDYAKKYQKNSQAKYSHYKVGAALLAKNGEIFGGCNVESSSYGLTICAERVALTKALSEGFNDFVKIAVIGPNNEFCPPCGACRQLLHDYATDLEIVLSNNKEIKTIKLKDLLPLAFEEKNLRKK